MPCVADHFAPACLNGRGGSNHLPRAECPALRSQFQLRAASTAALAQLADAIMQTLDSASDEVVEVRRDSQSHPCHLAPRGRPPLPASTSLFRQSQPRSARARASAQRGRGARAAQVSWVGRPFHQQLIRSAILQDAQFVVVSLLLLFGFAAAILRTPLFAFLALVLLATSLPVGAAIYGSLGLTDLPILGVISL